jgi:hypothetical protein
MLNIAKYTNCQLMNLIKMFMLEIVLSNVVPQISFAGKAKSTFAPRI